MGLIEELIQSVWERFMGVTLTRPFQKMEYEEAMRVYGSDKPDTRFGLHITDVTPMLDVPQGDTEHVVEYILIRNAQDFLSVKESDTIKSQILSERFPHLGDNVKAQDLLFVKVKEDGDVSWQGKIPFLKGLSDSLKSNPGHELCSVKPGDMLILNRRIGGFNGGTTILGRVRSLLGLVLERKSLHGVSKNSHSFLWVHSFPMFTPDPQSVGGWSATHHPFTAPLTDDSHHLFTKTNQVRGQTYDLVYNGVELGGGSIRIHEADLQRLVLTKILGLSEDRVNADFGHLLGALTSGCPPHGGIALGFDRLLSILCQTENIRSVIAFPKWAGRDLMVGAPSKVRTDELKEFGISVKGQE